MNANFASRHELYFGVALSIRRVISFVAWTFAVLLLSGCGSTHYVKVVFEPKDATVKLTNLNEGGSATFTAQPPRDPEPGEIKVPPTAGVVPLTLRFNSASAKYQIAVSREGFKTASRTLDPAAAAALPHYAERGILKINLAKTYSIRFVCEPIGANLRLTDPDGVNQLVRSNQEVDLHLSSDGRAYKLSAWAEGFVRQEWSIDLQRVLDAQRDSGGVIRFDLPSESFIDQRQLIVTYDPKAGFVGQYRNVRAFKADSGARERVTKILDLPDGLGIRGMTVTPDSRMLVYSIAETGTPPPSAVDAEDASARPASAVSLKGCRLKSFTLYPGRSVGDLPTTDYIDTDPFFLSDAGMTLLFASNGKNRRSTSDVIAVSQAAPDELRILQRGTAEAAMMYPSAGADGTLAFVRIPNGGDGTPETLIIDGRKRAIEARPAPAKIAHATQARLSPDGSRIAYIDRETSNIMIAESNGAKAAAITTKGKEIREFLRSRQPGYDAEVTPPFANPTWSPDGRYILYTGIEALDRNGRPNEDIWLIPASSGAKPIQLTNDGSVDMLPLWSRDNSIYFVSNRGGKWAIYRLPLPTNINIAP